jgi:SAM-dependent methyltransferase
MMNTLSLKNSWMREELVHSYNRNNVFRVRVVFPDIWECLKKQKANLHLINALDYGCGGGLFLSKCPNELKDTYFVGYDISEPQLKYAENMIRHLDHRIHLTDTLEYCAPGHYDAVTSIAVWMTWPTSRSCKNNLRTIRRLLRPNGVAYFALPDPRHRDRDPEFDHRFDMKFYNFAGRPFDVIRRGHSEDNKFTDYHWSYEELFKQLRKAGFHGVISVYNYPPDRPDVKGSYWLRITARPG